MRRRFLWAMAVSLAMFPGLAWAELKPHALFTDHMVMQQGAKIPVWGTADDGAKITLKIKGKEYSGVAKAGEWKVEIDPLPVGGPYELVIAADEAGTKSSVVIKDILVGEVWVCSGQSNMEFQLKGAFEASKDIADSKNDKIRLFTVNKQIAEEPQKGFKKGSDLQNKWLECNPETSPSFSAVGYYFGKKLQKELGVPIGLIHTSWGGTPAEAWTSKESLNKVDALKHYYTELEKAIASYDPEKAKAKYEADKKKYEEAVAKIKKENEGKPKDQQKPLPKGPSPLVKPGMSQNNPSRLYNGMIYPLLPFPIAGAIWYQGESNSGRAYEYRTLMPTMIEDWRKAWGKDFPFFMVQLAPYLKINPEPIDSAWAELREAQLMTTKTLPKVGMAVITDVGEETDIHPKKKGPVGERLAISALTIAYGKSNEPSGPEYKSVKFDGNKAILTFDHLGGGLVCKGEKLTGFTIAGADKKFHNAEAKIEGDHIVVWSDKVEKPVAVRYGWANYPVLNLWSKADLPATPFRTDEFPGVTAPKAN